MDCTQSLNPAHHSLLFAPTHSTGSHILPPSAAHVHATATPAAPTPPLPTPTQAQAHAQAKEQASASISYENNHAQHTSTTPPPPPPHINIDTLSSASTHKHKINNYNLNTTTVKCSKQKHSTIPTSTTSSSSTTTTTTPAIHLGTGSGSNNSSHCTRVAKHGINSGDNGGRRKHLNVKKLSLNHLPSLLLAQNRAAIAAKGPTTTCTTYSTAQAQHISDFITQAQTQAQTRKEKQSQGQGQTQSPHNHSSLATGGTASSTTSTTITSAEHRAASQSQSQSLLPTTNSNTATTNSTTTFDHNPLNNNHSAQSANLERKNCNDSTFTNTISATAQSRPKVPHSPLTSTAATSVKLPAASSATSVSNSDYSCKVVVPSDIKVDTEIDTDTDEQRQQQKEQQYQYQPRYQQEKELEQHNVNYTTNTASTTDYDSAFDSALSEFTNAEGALFESDTLMLQSHLGQDHQIQIPQADPSSSYQKVKLDDSYGDYYCHPLATTNTTSPTTATTVSALTAALRRSSSSAHSPASTDTTTSTTATTTITAASSSSSPDTYYTNLSTSDHSSPPSLNISPQPKSPRNIEGSFPMPSSTSPIDIATPTRNSSSSPSSQGTKVGQQYPGLDKDSRTSAMMSGGGLDPNMGRERQPSFAGAKPISMNNPNRSQDNRARRESLAGSLVQGMSWGGVSVGSWIRDDIIMTGTSPFPYQSPSYHSSSYLPKLEANFMRDFSCCGKTLPSLHDLLQHYEECHAQQTPQSMRQASIAQQARQSQQPDNRAAVAAQVQQQTQKAQIQQQGRPQSSAGMRIPQTGGASALTGGIQQMRQQQQQQSQPTTPTQSKAQPAVSDEMDGVEDMEMDDPVGPMDPIDTTVPNVHQNSQSGFGQRPALNLTNTNGMIHQGLRTSQPTTPSTAGFGFQNNPTVSSVNTPTLTTQPVQGQGTFSPDASAPGTPAEMEEDFSNMMNMNNMTMGNMNMNLANLGNMNNVNMFGLNNDLGIDLCIDEPAKRLYSPNGGFGTQQQRQLQQQLANFNLGNNAFGNMTGMQGMGNMSNEELMRRLQQQRLLQINAMNGGMGNQQAAFGLGNEEHKPFKCPVIGCEKAYKNQNGLKYHKTHGHQTQQLHENGDGTFSIVNPETSAPYPGTLGMEKEKPYKCDVCGKRYKNLNGLKYHKQHSPPCNPEMKLNGHLQAVGLGGLGVNVAGLPGIGEEMM